MPVRKIAWGTLLLTVLCSHFLPATAAIQQHITHYNPLFLPGYNKQGQLKIAIRSYITQGKLHYLMVDPQSLLTETTLASHFKSRRSTPGEKPGYFSWDALQNTRYGKALQQYAKPPYLLQNYGLTSAQQQSTTGLFLTVDLCPSIQPFEFAFFSTLACQAKQYKRPLPIAIAISGEWLIQHPQELAWLLAQQKKNRFDITWVNHSFSHPYYQDLRLEENFLLSPQVNVDYEILATEQLLLSQQILPSIFFRFPGLVSDEQLVKKVNCLGLIPVGSCAWLAKNEPSSPGSIILVHGNGNEPAGIATALQLLQQYQQLPPPWLPLQAAL